MTSALNLLIVAMFQVVVLTQALSVENLREEMNKHFQSLAAVSSFRLSRSDIKSIHFPTHYKESGSSRGTYKDYIAVEVQALNVSTLALAHDKNTFHPSFRRSQ